MENLERRLSEIDTNLERQVNVLKEIASHLKEIGKELELIRQSTDGR